MSSMALIFTQPATLALRRINQSQCWNFPLSELSSSLKFSCYSSSLSSPPPLENPKKLILYSKPGCCLCDGLKEKLHAAFSLSSPSHSLHDVQLQIRDITTNTEWERAYQYEIPVLAKLRPDGTEETLPRLSPRLGLELIQRKISDAFRQ